MGARPPLLAASHVYVQFFLNPLQVKVWPCKEKKEKKRITVGHATKRYTNRKGVYLQWQINFKHF